VNITITAVPSRNKEKIWYTFEWGKGPGQRKAAKVFSYAKPKNQVEKNHNKQAQLLLITKKSQLILESQATGTGFIPAHRYQHNFLDYYADYVKNNSRRGNRHLEGSLKHFKTFLAKDFLAPIDITENFCTRFRQYLLDRFNGDTPANYFSRFKNVLKAATKEGYYRINPVEDVKAKSGKKRKLKEHLEAHEYIQLLKTPCYHQDIREAFILSCYTALRWCDVRQLDWVDIKGDQLKTRIIQEKTGEPLIITLHPISKVILEKRKAIRPPESTSSKVFKLPSHDGANKILGQWCQAAGIHKHITWHCARLSFSILLQDASVDDATVALLLGHTTTKYVHQTYKRHRPKDQSANIQKLPDFPSQQGLNVDCPAINN